MNYELFIAKRLLSRDKNNFSKPIVKLSIVSIALGLAVMIISVAILTGFQKKIQTKVIGFASHIQISKFDSNSSFEPNPISKNQDFYPCLDTIKGIKHIQVYAIKAGIIKTNEEIEGVVLKGVDSDYDWSFFKKNIIKGNYP
ncbi:MAG: ABC transporter permease, partial [Bacteroidales bacterium]|nr:ABC transporter permease [Bacteroidales bacterium]